MSNPERSTIPYGSVTNRSDSRARRQKIAFCTVSLLLLAGMSLRWGNANKRSSSQQITFNRDIAPIIHQNCSGCHRPGQTGPFPLLSFEDVRRHASAIAEVIRTGLMPPWPPEPGGAPFLDERRLTSTQIGLIQSWVAGGMTLGNPADWKAPGPWVEGWELGAPDLILRMPEAYVLTAEGRDVYRSFVLPIAVERKRYVRAMEFHPSNRSVHHASMRLDSTPESRLMDAKDSGVGFGGMDLPASAVTPDGHLLSWQPGRLAYRSPPGLPWSIMPGSDFVLQLHLKPSGKPESIQSEIGLYFTETAPTNQFTKLVLRSSSLDIPAGHSNYVAEDSYRLPVDTYIIGLNPHAHYLGKDLQGVAALPDGSLRTLLHIPRWDFKWQGNYTFARPVLLPKGTQLKMRYTYDNSESNPNNPNHPPERVRYGVQTTDEMAELWFQVLTPTTNDWSQLVGDFRTKELKGIMSFYEYRLAQNPGDARAHSALGSALMSQGKTAEATWHFNEAIAIDDTPEDPHYFLGLIARRENKLAVAREEFTKAIQRNPNHYKAYGNLGFMAASVGALNEAEHYLTEALRIHPRDDLSLSLLNEIQKRRPAR